MRRLRLNASSVVPGSIGWNSPKPAATRRCGDTPLPIRYCTTEMARAAESSQLVLNGEVAESCRVSVWPSTRSTQLISGGNLFFQVEQGGGELVELGAAFRPQHRRAAIEEDFRLEHEAVADDADVGAVAEDFAQLAEEIRAVARQFLHPLRQRDVQALAEVGDVQLGVLFLLLGGAERVLERGDLPAQRADLLVEVFDLGDGARGRRLLQIDLRVERIDLAAAPAPAFWLSAAPRRRSRSPSAADSEACSCATSSSRLTLPVRSSESRSESREICALRRASAVSLPATSCDRKNCATMNTVSKKMIDRISVDSASTKPGQ